MKKIFIAILAFSAFGCDTLDELTKFNMPYETSITVSTTTQIDIPITLSTPPVTTNAESTFSSNNTNADLVEEILLTEMILTVTTPNGGDFGFLKEVTLFINADGLSELEIAASGPVDASIGSELILVTTENNLMEYLKKNSFTIKVSVTTDEVITEDHEIAVNANFQVDAKILGI